MSNFEKVDGAIVNTDDEHLKDLRWRQKAVRRELQESCRLEEEIKSIKKVLEKIYRKFNTYVGFANYRQTDTFSDGI